MKFYSWILGIVFLNCFSVVSQEMYLKHTVAKGETITKISKLYNIKADSIFELNPGSKEGIKINSVLLIPNLAVNNKKSNSEAKTFHIVQPQETLFGIAKQYHISLKDLYNVNHGLENSNLKIDQKIIIPLPESADEKRLVVNGKPNKQQTTPNTGNVSSEKAVLAEYSINDKNSGVTITREVLPKETKYGIAKEYGISVKELERQNPDIINSLPIGYKLAIYTSKLIEPTVVSQQEIVSKKENSDTPDNLIEKLVLKASENLGTRYRAGGITKEGFDCSGLMYSTFGLFDIILPRSSFEQSQYGVKVNTEEAKKGDLIFFKTNGKGKINHVGMVVEVLDGSIKFIHSASHGGVMVSSTEESYYAKNLVQVNRVL